MKVLEIGFVGTRTVRPEAMADFLERVLGLQPTHSGDDMWAFRLPDGGIAEVFGPSQNEHLTNAPVVEALVENVEGRPRGAPRGGRSDRVRSRSCGGRGSRLGALPGSGRQHLRGHRRPGSSGPRLKRVLDRVTMAGR